jgi:hypothetical protein
MRTILAILLLALTDPSGHAQAPQVERIDVTEYGTYTTKGEQTYVDAKGIKHHTVSKIVHDDSTRTIPLRRDVIFGFRYRVIGSPKGAKVPLRIVVLYPAPGLARPGSPAPIMRDEEAATRTIGADSITSYGLEEPWELLPGDWTLEIWSGDRKMASQTFTVVKQ